MKSSVSDLFLQSERAHSLYRSVQPHLAVRKEERVASNLAERWLAWQPLQGALRAAGVDEIFITGNASDYEKLEALLSAAPLLSGHHALRWCQYDLAEQLGCTYVLAPENCARIWAETSQTLSAMPSEGKTKVFRPVSALIALEKGIRHELSALSLRSDVPITDYPSLLRAFSKELDAFCAAGGERIALSIDPEEDFLQPDEYHAAQYLMRAAEKDGKGLTVSEKSLFRAQMVRFFGRECKRRSLCLQLDVSHTVVCNTQRLAEPVKSIKELADLLVYLKESDALPQTLLSCQNPADLNTVVPLFAAFEAIGSAKPQLLSVINLSPCFDAARLKEQLAALAARLPLGSITPLFAAPVSLTRDLFARVLCDLVADEQETGGFCGDDSAAVALILSILQ